MEGNREQKSNLKDDNDEDNEEYVPKLRRPFPLDNNNEISSTSPTRGVRRGASSSYPGLALGLSMFGSDTLMKLGVIRNELQNILRSQLKRVDGELHALLERVKAMDSNLESSERFISVSSNLLSEIVEWRLAHCEDEDLDSLLDADTNGALSRFDLQLRLLDLRLKEAREANQS